MLHPFGEVLWIPVKGLDVDDSPKAVCVSCAGSPWPHVSSISLVLVCLSIVILFAVVALDDFDGPPSAYVNPIDPCGFVPIGRADRGHLEFVECSLVGFLLG